MTIHKVQGLTCDYLVFDPTNVPTSAFAYVGLSRVKRRDHIILTHMLALKTTQQQRRAAQILRNETQRMSVKSVDTTTQHGGLIARMKVMASTLNQASFAR